MDQFKLGKTDECPPNVTLFIDEWQMLADSSIHNLLEQGAGLGVHFLLANQDIAQLERNERGLESTVWENCASKVIFTARDPVLQDRIMKASGEKTVHVPSYQVSVSSLQQGRVESGSALSSLNGAEIGAMISESRVPLIERNDLIELSDHPSHFLFFASQGASVTRFGGFPVVLESEFALSADDYDFLNKLPWPAPTPETIVPAEYRQTTDGSASAESPLDSAPPRPNSRTKRTGHNA